MRVIKVGSHNIGVISADKMMADYNTPEKFSAKAEASVKSLFKADKPKLQDVLTQTSILPPANMRKLLDLLDADGYHASCCSAIADGTIMNFASKNKQVQNWIDNSQNQGSIIGILRNMVKHYEACGNGFALKVRNKLGEWVGLEILLPQEIELKTNYDDNGFLKPNFVQYKNGKKKPFLNKDVIHLLKPHHKSNVWGLSSLPVAQGIETLREIKKLDYNNFKSGLLIDYFIIVQGGSLNDDLESEDGLSDDVTSRIEEALRNATGTKHGHSSILIESDDPGVKIELVPLRQTLRDGEFINLKKDIRNETLTYHRVPPRIASQATAGELGGDNNSDMVLFYNLVLKPIEREFGEILSRNFRDEFGWKIKSADWDFGDLTELFESDDMKMLKQASN